MKLKFLQCNIFCSLNNVCRHWMREIVFMSLILVLHSFNRKRFNIMSFIPFILNEAYYFEFDAHFREQTRDETSETWLFTHYVSGKRWCEMPIYIRDCLKDCWTSCSKLFNSHYNWLATIESPRHHSHHRHF